jgi:serine/threonine-protein kinase
MAESAPRFGDYRLVERLARGGTGELWLARSAASSGGRTVVLKHLLPSLVGEPRFARVIEDEGRALAALDHPGIPRLVEAGDAEGVPFVVMEQVDGRDLRAVIECIGQRGLPPISLEQSLAIVLGLCAPLAAIHERGLVHRDVSPGNVMLGFAGGVTLVDFSFALAIDTPGIVRGTAGHMSPEQVRGDPLDGRSDVFAAGILLFELTTGRRLFRGNTEYETAILVRDRDVPPPSHVRPDYPAELERVVLRALARDRSVRTPSARELAADLGAFVTARCAEAAVAQLVASVFG